MKYTFTAGKRIEITGVGDFFRLLSTVGAVTVEYYVQGREIAERIDVEAGYAESFRTVNFDRVDITSATAQTVQWETALGSEIRYDRGAATISGTVGLDAATLLALEQISVRGEQSTGNYKTQATLAVNTAETVFTPGANVNGAIILSAEFVSQESSSHNAVFIAKAGAVPTTIIDGEVIVSGKFTSSSAVTVNGQLQQPTFIAAGLGLYFIASAAQTAGGGVEIRNCRYKLL